MCLSEVGFNDVQKFSGDSRRKNHFELTLNHCIFCSDVIVKWWLETTPSLKVWIICSILKMLRIQCVNRALLDAFSVLIIAALDFSSIFSYPLSSQQALSIWGAESDFSSLSLISFMTEGKMLLCAGVHCILPADLAVFPLSRKKYKLKIWIYFSSLFILWSDWG